MRLFRLIVVGSFLVSASSAFAQWTTNAGDIVPSSTSADVGIGTTAPTAKLTVFGSGSFNATGAARIDLTNGIYGNYGLHVDDSGYLRLIDAGGAPRIMVETTGGRYVYVYDHLYVGTSTAGSVQATSFGNWSSGGAGNIDFATATGNVDFSQTNATKGAFRWIASGSEKMRLSRGGNLGIGAVGDALDRLHVKDGHVRIEHSDPSAQLSGIFFYEGTSLFGFLNQRGSTAVGEPMQFNLGNAHPNGVAAFWAGGNPRVTISAAGRVGIGVAPSATHTLSVAGDAHFSGKVTGGNIVAKYQDIAEWVPSVEELEAGTVVVLDPERTNHVKASAQAYDTSVAGVVSEQPGLILGEEDPSKAMIATTGRVRVRVDATTHPIRIGDLLATSGVPGTAMKSEPMEINGRRFHQPGTIIGKALEPLEDGVGEILVLLSMQ